MKILIGGGTGFIGKRLVKYFRDLPNFSVNVISRTPAPSCITWDNINENSIHQSYDAIINLAGENLLQPFKWNSDFAEKLRSSRIDTTRILANYISTCKNPPKVWISTSGVGYYEPDEYNRYTELSEPGNDFLAKLCIDWEKASILSDDCPTRHVIIRTGVVLGRDGGTIYRMWLPFFMGLGGRIGSGKQWFPWIHINDLVEIFNFVIENNKICDVVNAVSPSNNRNEEFVNEFAKSMWRPAIFPLPEFVLKIVFGPVLSKVILEGQCVIPEKLIKNGFQFKYPDLKSACKEFSEYS